MGDDGNNRRTLDDYERGARDYVAEVDSTPSPLGAAALRALVDAVAPGTRVLEIGSGPGWDADFLETLGVNVRRTDATAAFRDIQAERGKRIDPLDVLVDPVPGPNDGIVMLYVLQHFTHDALPEVMRKLVDALRPGGALLLSYLEGDDDHHLEHTVDGDYRVVHWTRTDFDARLAQAGLAIAWERAFQGKDWPWRIVLGRKTGATSRGAGAITPSGLWSR